MNNPVSIPSKDDYSTEEKSLQNKTCLEKYTECREEIHEEVLYLNDICVLCHILSFHTLSPLRKSVTCNIGYRPRFT